MDNFKNFSKSYLTKLINSFSDDQLRDMKVLAQELRNIWDKNNTLFICGNGGSGANAMHIANDLHYGIGDMLNHKKNGIKVDALTSNTAVITCLANDLGYENIFSNQIEVKASKDDLLVVLSGSGNSQNVVNALKVATSKGMKTISILGFDGGMCKELSETSIFFPVQDMQIAEDTQVIVFNICIKWIVEQINNQTD